MRLPIDNEIMQNEETHNHMESETSIVIEAFLQTREKLYVATGLNVSLAQREQKELYDSKHNPNELQVGNTVLTRQKKRKGCKIDDCWLGPHSGSAVRIRAARIPAVITPDVKTAKRGYAVMVTLGRTI